MDKTLPPVGIDVSKLTLDARLLAQESAPGPFKRFANSPDGLTQMQQWFERQGLCRVHACLEATGTYSDAVARFLYEQGHQVSLANPARVAAFRTSEGIRTKTDRHDALVLARFCAQKRPALWSPTPEPVQQLQVLVGRHEELLTTRQQERNRLENHRLDGLTRQEIADHLGWLQTQLERTLHRASALLSLHRDLQEACDHLDSIPGIARLTAMRLYSVFFDHARFCRAAKLVAHAGLCSAKEDSGTSVHRKASISKQGNAQVRKWLYMSALSVMRYDPDFVEWVAELKARGKSGKLIVVAVMRKLLHIVHGVLKSGEDYDPRKAFPAHYRSANSQAQQEQEQEQEQIASVRKHLTAAGQQIRLITWLHHHCCSPSSRALVVHWNQDQFPVLFFDLPTPHDEWVHFFRKVPKYGHKSLTNKTVSTREVYDT